MRASIDAMIPRSNLFALSREDLHCVCKRDPAARTRLAGLTTHPDLHALIAHRLTHALWRRNWRYLARFLGFLTCAITQVGIDPGARIGANSMVIQHVPAQMTVIDIPGRMSLPLVNRHIAEHGIDHHLRPDPVGKAVSCLLERITRLVSPLAAVTGKRVPVSGDCDVCVDGCDPVQVSVSDNLKRNPTDQWMLPRINL